VKSKVKLIFCVFFSLAVLKVKGNSAGWKDLLAFRAKVKNSKHKIQHKNIPLWLQAEEK
jgi:hypothetical protein